MGGKEWMTRWINIAATLVSLGLATAFIIYAYQKGILASEEDFRNYIESFGHWAPTVFILIQILSVVVPVLPTTLGTVSSVVIFGPWLGFTYNYIAICAGSIGAFFLSRKKGTPFVRAMIGEKAYTKYIGWLDMGHKFNRMFAVAIIIPVMPDDLLCYIAGLTKIRARLFILIILAGKIPSIAVYSIGITAILHFLRMIFG